MKSAYSFDLATTEDDRELRELIARNPIAGKISLAYKREPSFFESIKVMGHDNTVLTIRYHKYDSQNGQDNQDKKSELIGFGIASKYHAFVDGKQIELGYLSSLRIDAKHRGIGLLARGYRYFQQTCAEKNPAFYLSTIIEDNVDVIKLLSSKRLSLPHYIDLGRYTTFAIGFKKKKLRFTPTCEIRRVSGNEEFEKVVQFINEQGRKKNCYPSYTPSQLIQNPCFQPHHMFVAYRGGEIVGTITKWDQVAIKQTVVTSYKGLLKYLRPCYNAFANLLGMVKLPKVGKHFSYPFFSMMAIKNDDLQIFDELLKTFHNEELSSNYHYFVLGLHENDPLNKIVKKYKHYCYNARLYYVSYNPDWETINKLKGSSIYIETARL